MSKTNRKPNATKAAKYAHLVAEAKKWEVAAVALWDQGKSIAGDAIWKRANELFSAANAYGIRWNI